MLITNLLYFTFYCAILIFSGIYLVKSLSKIARFLRISEFSAAFIIMAFATSIPELFVGISSATAGNPALSLGNIIGANIIDLTLITGIIILSAKEIKFKSRKIGNEVYFMLGVIATVMILYLIGGSLSRLDGIILLCLFGLHANSIFKKRHKYTKKTKKPQQQTKRFMWLVIFILAVVGLFISSGFVVKYASNLAQDLNFPEIMIGLFLLSIATTLPELVFGVSASIRHKEMAIGDQIGTVVANSALILGLVSIIHPIKAEFLPLIISGTFMFIAAFIFTTFVKTGRKLERMEGISLILIYVLFVVIELFAK